MPWPELTAENTFFVVVHSGPMGKFHRGEKKKEGRPRRVHRKFVTLVSPVHDNPDLPYESDPSVLMNATHCVGRVARVEPGDDFAWNWCFDPLVVLDPPVPMRAAVGRHGGGHVSPRPEHGEALAEINRALRKLAICDGPQALTHSHTHSLTPPPPPRGRGGGGGGNKKGTPYVTSLDPLGYGN